MSPMSKLIYQFQFLRSEFKVDNSKENCFRIIFTIKYHITSNFQKLNISLKHFTN